MTPKQSRSLARYIGEITRDYGLSGWRIIGHEGTDSDDHAAEVSCVFGRKVAHLNLSTDFTTYPPEEQRTTVLHELTHIHLDQVTALIHQALPEMMGKPAFDAFMAGYTQAMEHATDAIATAISHKYPLWEG